MSSIDLMIHKISTSKVSKKSCISIKLVYVTLRMVLE